MASPGGYQRSKELREAIPRIIWFDCRSKGTGRVVDSFDIATECFNHYLTVDEGFPEELKKTKRSSRRLLNHLTLL
jgi:hypothetical protein